MGRMRRFTLNADGAVAGARDLNVDDSSEWNGDKSDDDASGDFVRMSEGPYSVRFELLAPDTNIVTGYYSSLVVTGKVITVSSGAEASEDQTWTLSDGYLKVGGQFNTDNPGRIAVEGEFKTLAIT